MGVLLLAFLFAPINNQAIPSQKDMWINRSVVRLTSSPIPLMMNHNVIGEWTELTAQVKDIDETNVLVEDSQGQIGWISRSAVIIEQASLQRYNEAIIKQPLNDELYRLRGALLLRSSDVENAFADFDKAITINSSPDTHNAKGLGLIAIRKYEEAINEFSIAWSLNKKITDSLYNRALVFAYLHDYNKSIDDCNLAITLNSRDIKSYRLRSSIYSEFGDHDKAVRDIDTIIKAFPNNALLYHDKGAEYLLQCKFIQAIGAYDMAIRINPKYRDAYKDRGTAYMSLNRFASAVDEYSKAIELDKTSYCNYTNRGIARTYLREYEKAIEDFNHALAINSKDEVTYYSMGNALFGIGEYDRAISYIEKGLRFDPDNPTAILLRGNCWYNLRKYETAYQDYQRALKLRPDGENELAALAWMLATCSVPKYRNGKDALKLAESAYAKSSRNVLVLTALAASHAELGDWESAIEIQKLAFVRSEEKEKEDMKELLALYYSHKQIRK